MTLHLLRIVMNSGSLTELMFDSGTDAAAAHDLLMSGGTVTDDYGHEFAGKQAELAATILVDLNAELKGQSAVTFARQMMQDGLAERVHKTRGLTAPPVMMRPPNGSIIQG